MNYPFNSSRIAQIRYSAFLVGMLGLSAIAGAQATLAPVAKTVPSVVGRAIMMSYPKKSQVLHIAVSLKPSDPQGLQAFVDDVSNPASANYGKFINPEDVGDRFGMPASVVQEFVDYMTAKGFSIKLVSKNHLTILADCTISQAQTAFHTTIENYQTITGREAGRQNFYSFSSTPELPVHLAGYVQDISGLENFTQPKRLTTLTPSMTRVLYNTAPIYNGITKGTGRTIGISNWDGYLVSNVPTFYTTFGLPAPAGGLGSNVSVVPVDGGNQGEGGGEGDLDIQMPLAIAPFANLIFYDGGGDLIDVLTEEANDNNADIISESWGWNLDAATSMAAHNLHLSMEAQGITYMNASGDSGTSIEPFSYPDRDPETLQVGGTTATTDSQGVRLGEIGWSGSGGGWSTVGDPFNVLPSWQVGTGVPTNINFRLGPDVALHASDNFAAYDFVYNGAVTAGDGTSFASPTFAGCLAEVEAQLIVEGKLTQLPNGKYRMGRLQDLVYSQNQRPDVWHDITVGNNGTLPNGMNSNCQGGWDFVTGMGSLDFEAFEQSLNFTPPAHILPGAAQVFMGIGSNPQGTVANLKTLDNQYYSLSSILQSGVGQVAAAQVTFTLTGDTTKTSQLTFTVAGKAASSASGFLYLYNNATKTWDLLKSIGMNGSEKTYTMVVRRGKLGPYIDANKKVLLVVRALRPLRITTNPFTLRLDETVIDEAF